MAIMLATLVLRLRNFPYKPLAHRFKMGLDSGKKKGRNIIVAGGMA